MGDRGQVHMKDLGVWLYTHWSATELPDLVRKSLGRSRGKDVPNLPFKEGGRWDDPEYLTRIIFCDMLEGDLEGLTGYGIGKDQHGDVYRVIEIQCPARHLEQEDRIRVLRGDKGETVRWEGSFDEFINSDINWYEDEED